MTAFLLDLELQLLDSMSQEQLLAELKPRQHCLTCEMSGEWLCGRPPCALRMLLLAAKLIDVVRRRGNDRALRH
jgi:hypothetical protein